MVLAALPTPRVFHVPKDSFEQYNDTEFQLRYRVRKHTVMRLCYLIGNYITPETHRNQSTSSLNQILITLRFLATGAFQILLGYDMNVHISTICRIIQKVIPRIAALCNEFIYMLRNALEIETKRDFHSIAGFPSVIGCVDGTQIKIQYPGGEDAKRYRNRKSYFLYNVQVV